MADPRRARRKKLKAEKEAGSEDEKEDSEPDALQSQGDTRCNSMP